MATVNDLTRFFCLFHDAERGRAAVSALEGAGIAGESVHIIGAGEQAGVGDGTLADLRALGVPERDLTHLQDGVRQGGVLVWLEAPEDQSDAIERVFHRYSADKIDEAALATAGAGIPASADVVIPVAEEALLVGKREVDRGGVRVYRRTVEEPVSEDVQLHGERVVVEHREVSRPATEADLQAGEQAIELVETAEVPVVQKVARVVEEVRVGKVAEERTEVVEDTLRHTEVEIEPAETTARHLGTIQE